jgi:hypothetical protein
VDDGGGGTGGHLQNAANVLRRSLCLDSTESWPASDLPGQRDREIACLELFATAHDLWLNADGFTDFQIGGQEHDYRLVGHPDPQRIQRITKDGCGFYPQPHPILHISPGTPLQYFTRLLLMGTLFPELRHRLEGFIMLKGQFTIVTSQQFIPGRPLTEETRDDSPKRPLRLIEHWFQQLGYQKLHLSQSVGPSMAWYHREENIAVFDAKPANILIWEDALFPVDVIPVQPTGILLKKILAAL